MRGHNQHALANALFAVILIFHIPHCHSSFLTGTPAAYLGIGDIGAIPVIDAYDFLVNDAGSWSMHPLLICSCRVTDMLPDMDVGGDVRWSQPYFLHSQAQRRGLQPQQSVAVSPEYSISYSTAGTCSTDITVKDADTGEIIVQPRNLNVGLWSITKGRRIVFGLRTYKTLGIGIGCGQVDWSITTTVAHYTFGSDLSNESKKRAKTRRPPLIALRSGFY